MPLENCDGARNQAQEETEKVMSQVALWVSMLRSCLRPLELLGALLVDGQHPMAGFLRAPLLCRLDVTGTLETQLFAATACTWAVQSFFGDGSCVPSSRLWSVPGPPEPLVELPPPVRLVLRNPPGTTAPLWHALINVQGVPARLHPRQRRISPDAVLKT